MGFSTAAQTAFDGWLNVDTWHTTHPLDEGRFHRFVWAAVHAGDDVPESDVERAILSKYNGKLDKDFLEERAHELAMLYRTLLDFGRAQDA